MEQNIDHYSLSWELIATHCDKIVILPLVIVDQKVEYIQSYLLKNVNLKTLKCAPPNTLLDCHIRPHRHSYFIM